MIPTEQPLPQIEAVVERQAEASAVPRPDPLGIEDVPTQARSKVRLIAVICGLYVCKPQSDQPFRQTKALLGFVIHSSSRSSHCINRHPHHLV